MTRDPDDVFAGFKSPSAPRGLRRRVLAATAVEPTAPEVRRPARSFVDRLWESRPLRLAWAATVAVLVTVHLALANDIPRPAASFASSVRGLESNGSPLTVADSDLLRLLHRHPVQRTRVAVRKLSLDVLASEPSSTRPVTAPEGGSV